MISIKQGTPTDAIVLLNKGLLEILSVFLEDKRLKSNTTTILINLMDFAKQLDQDECHHDFNNKLRSLKESLKFMGMSEILLDNKFHSEEI